MTREKEPTTRLVDIDKARKEYSNLTDLTMNDTTLLLTLFNVLDNAPTIEAIPKADYEARLKADMAAMLTELKNKFIDKSWNIDMYDDDLDFECCYLTDIDEIIQQKINALKADRSEEDGNVD